jgi:type II secretion system protein H
VRPVALAAVSPCVSRSRSARPFPAGFTLIELMVVIVIIGLLTVTTLLSLGGSGRDSQLEQERDRLGGLIDYVRERAALQTVEYGLRCEQGGYRFLMYDTRKGLWVEDLLDDVLRARTLPAGLEIALVVEDRPIVLPRSAGPTPPRSAVAPGGGAASPGGSTTSLQSTVAEIKPQVMLYSSGDLTSFKLTLSRAGTNRSAALTGTTAGKFEVGAIVEKPT